MPTKQQLSLLILLVALLRLVIAAPLAPSFAQDATVQGSPQPGASNAITSSLPVTTAAASQLSLYLPLVLEPHVQTATDITTVVTTTAPLSVYLPLVQQGTGETVETPIEVMPTEPVSAAATALDVRIATENDDGEESSSGSVNLTSTDLDMMMDSGGRETIRVTALRFSGLTIPRGATIVTAYVQFQSDEVTSETTTLTLQGEAVDHALAFGVTKGALSTKPRTAAAVTWSPAAWTTVGTTWAAQRATNLAPILQELVNRPGWASGNAMTLLITGSGQRVAKSFESASNAAPLLHIEYR